jgi:putative membrane protein
MSQPNPVATRRKWQRLGALLAVALIPLAFVGLLIAALSNSDTALDRIPAAIVNDDELITTTAPDGTEQPIFAGRQLVTELTGDDSVGFDWIITNADDARKALESGEVYAILTVPENFSSSVTSLQTTDPVKANISIETDDSHSYLTGSLLQVVGESLVGAFGATVTEQYIGGIYASIGGLGSSLSSAAGGATELAAGARQLGVGAGDLGSGAAQLASGAGELASGASGLGGGASQLTSGLRDYTGGVSSLSGGLGTLNQGAGQLSGLSTGVSGYTGGVAQLLDQVTPIVTGLQAAAATPEEAAQYQALLDGFAATRTGGTALAQQTAAAVGGIQNGIAQSASGAARLAAGGAPLVSGASGLVTGATGLANGATGLSDGATALQSGAGALSTGADSLASGAETLASGLTQGAAAIPAQEDGAAENAASVAAEPVTLSVSTDNEVSDIGQVIATFFVPLGLWIGALAVFLVLRPFTRRALASTAVDGRLVTSALLRASAVTSTGALLLVALLHTAVGVSWSALPATLPFSLLVAVSFTAFHFLLTSAFGRGGLVVSLFLLAIQLTATGGIYPIEVLSTPFRAISPFLPLTHAVDGIQGIIAGGSAVPVVTAAVLLLLFGALSALLSLATMRRRRSARGLGLTVVAG